LVNAKELLYPQSGAMDETPAHTQMYKKTHANFAPGEQRQREYDWHTNPVIQGNPDTHSFGFGE
jgi:hypothetical protein